MNRADLSVGMEVIVYGNLYRRRAEDRIGVVEQIGRTLVYIKARGTVERFYIATQLSKDDLSGGFRTLEQEAELGRRDVAIKRLNAHGLEFSYRFRSDIEWTADALGALVITADAVHPLPAP